MEKNARQQSDTPTRFGEGIVVAVLNSGSVKILIAAIAVLVFATVSLAASSTPYFHHPELVAKAMERHFSNREPSESSLFGYGQLDCRGSRDLIRCDSTGYVQGYVRAARVEWKLSLLSNGIHALLSSSWYATEATGDGYVAGEEIREVEGHFDTILAETIGLTDWMTGAPLHPTDGTWLPDWAKRFHQPAQVARAFRAAIGSYPVASGKLPPGFTRTGPHRIKQGPARCSGGQKLIRCSASGRMLRTEAGKGPQVPVTVRWRLTKYSARSARVDIGVYSSVDAPYDRATFSGPWKKGEWIDTPKYLGGTYRSGSDIAPSVLGLKQW